MPKASECRQEEEGAPKSFILRQYLESKTLVAPHPRTVRLNCDSTTLAVISDSSALALYR